MASELKYKETWLLRREILQTLGVNTDGRFGSGSQRGIRKANLIVIASEVQPPTVRVDYAETRLTDIYQLLSKWLEVEHSPNAGRDWTMNRDLLKAIHEAVHND